MSNHSIKAIDAIQEAQKIAFAPFVFQATVSLRKLGVFDFIFSRRKKGGVSIDEVSKELEISAYGISVLLEIAETSNIVSKNDMGLYELTTIGYFLTYNETVNVNMNFTNELCYKPLFHLNESIKTGKPVGLKELGNWKTIYEGLSQLKPLEKKAWFEFDHHYSDDIFTEALEFVFKKERKAVFDIGANTGIYSVFSSSKNSTSQIYSFEPNPVNYSRLKRNIGYGKQLGGIGLTAATLGAPVAVGVALIAFVADGIKRDYSEKKSQSDSVFNIKSRGVRVNNFTYGGGYYG
jgi:hypothetical protein